MNNYTIITMKENPSNVYYQGIKSKDDKVFNCFIVKDFKVALRK